MMLQSCTYMATVGVKGLTILSKDFAAATGERIRVIRESSVCQSC